ncbi:pancreatic secretory granule membrane major glycoprotein GP2-like isoform X2 [Pogona vitticeps]
MLSFFFFVFLATIFHAWHPFLESFHFPFSLSISLSLSPCSFAMVSDDACSSGNYTTEMSLRPALVGQSLFSPVTFLARIVLKDDRSHASLSIKSCCVTPTARPARPEGAACCLFPRSLVECRHIQIHQNNKSRIANFTIQLFQMLDRSVVYLHCELGVCLSQQAGCKQSCVENKDSPSRPSERSSYETLHNVISLGPVLKPQAEFPPGPVAGSPVAVLLLGLVLSLMGTFVFLATIFVLWYHWRRQIKMAMNLEGQGSESP